MLFGGEFNDGGAKAGFGLEIERDFRFLRQQTFHFRVAMAGGQMLQVDPF